MYELASLNTLCLVHDNNNNNAYIQAAYDIFNASH